LKARAALAIDRREFLVGGQLCARSPTWAMLLVGFAGFGFFAILLSLENAYGTAAMAENDLRYRNARLRRKIDGTLKGRPELETVVDGIALKQPTNASLEQVQANLQERARAIIEAKPELDGYFDA
jgi:hypothetical protein